MDSYLEVARKVLREARRPLSAREILKTAYQLHVVPRDLYGRTQHKTLHARLSTDILKRRLTSDFYRTGPGRFYLRYFLGDRTTPARYRREYTAPLRAAQLGRFDVVALSRAEIAALVKTTSSSVLLKKIMSLPWQYARMDDLRHDTQLLPLRLFVVVVDDGRVVLSHKFVTTNKDLARRTALGIEGVIRREDRSLFSSDEAGLPDAAIRTLAQHLDLPRKLHSSLEEGSRWSTPIALYEEGDVTRSDDLIAALAFQCAGIPGFVEAIDGLASSEWLQLPVRLNDLGHFDRWSARFVADISLQLAVCG